MNAIVLAAGTGSRLRPLTIDRPKACITVDGIPIGEHQVRAYDAAGFDSVTFVAGYMPDRIRQLASRLDDELEIDVGVIDNPAFANTDNMYSLYCAREQVAGEPFVLSNGDVVFDPEIVEQLAAVEGGSAIAVDFDQYDPEAMKITVDEDEQVSGISKEFSPEEAAATSIDLYGFSAETSAKLFDRITTRIEIDEEYTGWTEIALNDILSQPPHDIRPVDISGAEWVEIDDHDDLLTADRTFSALDDIRSKDAVFFDLDGTIYLDETLIEGADRLVSQLRAADVDVYFLSNNSSRWKPTYADRLSGLGIQAAPEDIILSTDGVISYLLDNDITETYVVGTEALRGALEAQEIESTAADPDTVVVGFDTELTYEKVAAATRAIRAGAEFVLVHGDTVCPTEDGFIPDCGSIGALVETASERSPTRVFGKPNAGMIDHVIARHDYDPENVVVVGDRLSTDIALADRIGCQSVSVLSGETTRRAIESAEQSPTLVVDSVGDLASDDQPPNVTPVQEAGEI